ncbi:MAG: dockerin type I domain-containing protein [Acidobacteriota bacterium]
MSHRFTAHVLAAGLTVLLSGPVLAQDPSTHVLVLDQDAHALGGDNAGAIFNLDLGSGAAQEPTLVLAADTGADTWMFISGIALSPFDGRAYISDLGLERTDNPDGQVTSVDSSGVLRMVSTNFREPWGITFIGDGSLVVVDAEADPAGLAGDRSGGFGPGAVYRVDTTTGVVSLLSDGTRHGVPNVPSGDSAFVEPLGAAYDPGTGRLFVADASSDASGSPFGALFAVSLFNGNVVLISRDSQMDPIFSVAVEPSGMILAVDLLNNIWRIDPSRSVDANATLLSAGAQYTIVESVSVDEAGNIFVIDSGEFDADPPPGMFTVPPSVYRIDTAQPVASNAVAVLTRVEGLDTLVAPLTCAPVPIPAVTSISPRGVTDPGTVLEIRGDFLFSDTFFNFGTDLTVTNVQPDTDAPGSLVRVTVDPDPAIIAGGLCAEPTLVFDHGFGGTDALMNALSVHANAEPLSQAGDINGDGIVDGLDLASLTRRLGSVFSCGSATFANDADLNNDDLIDGEDLGILAAFFGLRP